MDLNDKLKQKLRDLPDKPGCYLMRDRRGHIIYVGKAASLRKRVQSYFRAATLRSAPPKLRGLIHSVEDLEYIVVGSEAEAILTEGKLIKDYRPRYNVSFKDDKRFLLLRVDRREPFPRLDLCRIRRDDRAEYFGPYASSAAARAALDFVEKRFGLRKCRARLPGEPEHRHCIDDIVRYCMAPCTGKTSPEDYAKRVEQAAAFLRGEDPTYLKELRAAMQEAAAANDFERAAAIRDTLFLLQAAVKQRTRLGGTPEVKAEDGRAGVRALQEALGLPRAPRAIEAYDISNISGTLAVASMVCAVDGLPQRTRYRHFRIRTVHQIDDPAMMGEVISRRFQRLREENATVPDLVLVDGGITQLRAALAEMRKLGFADVPVAGLAKQFEEIYVPVQESPIRLPRDSAALKVLQRIRDEAHRFALTYHRRLRQKVLRESALDAVPGIGEKRKQQILAHFGSVRRLQKATVEEISALPGIGSVLARAIKESLESRGSGAAEECG